MRNFLDETLVPHISGRMTRRRFWAGTVLLMTLAAAAASLVQYLYWQKMSEQSWELVDFSSVAVYVWCNVTAFTYLVRRLHDMGHNGAWALIYLVPGLGLLTYIVLGIIEGEPRANAYGPSPYGVGLSEAERIEALERLARLRESGAVSEEEYARGKAKLLF